MGTEGSFGVIIEFQIDSLPKRINEGHGSHWTLRYAESKRWLKLIQLKVAGSIPKEPWAKAKLTLIRGTSRCPDYNGLVYSFKVIEDALVKLKIIKNDTMDVIGRPDYKWEKAPPKKGYVKIRVERADNSKLEQV